MVAAPPHDPLETRLITGSRGKVMLYLLGSLAFVVLGVVMLRDPDSDAPSWGWAAIGFFGLCAAAFVGLLVRPQTLLLDPHGFTLGGGFVRSPRRIAWTEVQGFFVYTLPRGGRMVGYKLAASAATAAPLRAFNRSFGADGALPKAWPLRAETLADMLNAYRDEALRRG